MVNFCIEMFFVLNTYFVAQGDVNLAKLWRHWWWKSFLKIVHFSSTYESVERKVFVSRDVIGRLRGGSNHAWRKSRVWGSDVNTSRTEAVTSVVLTSTRRGHWGRGKQSGWTQSQRINGSAMVIRQSGHRSHSAHWCHGCRGHELMTHLSPIILRHRVGQVSSGPTHPRGVWSKAWIEWFKEIVDSLLLCSSRQLTVPGLNSVLFHRHGTVNLNEKWMKKWKNEK